MKISGDNEDKHTKKPQNLVSGKGNSVEFVGTPKIANTVAPQHTPYKPQYFKLEDITFKTIKTTVLVGAIGTAVFYGIVELLAHNRISGGRGALLGGSAIAGGFVGAAFGHDTYSFAKIYNDKASLLNRYKDRPEVQEKILDELGGTGFYYQRGQAEKTLSTLNNISLVGEIGSSFMVDRHPKWNTVHDILGVTTILTGAAWITSHFSGVSQAVQAEHQRVHHAERMALEKANRDTSSVQR